MADAVDAIVTQWQRARPDLEEQLWSVGVVGRLQRLCRLLDREIAAFCAGHGIQHWEFDVLLTLRRAEGPLTAGALLRASMVTSGAITNRIDRLEASGLVERLRDSSDRRSVRIQLTKKGRTLVDDVMADHLKNEARLLAALPADQREALTSTLRTLLESFNDTTLA